MVMHTVNSYAKGSASGDSAGLQWAISVKNCSLLIALVQFLDV
jgi:hypothetical protein